MEIGSWAEWFSGIATFMSTGVAVWLAVHQYIKESKDRMAREKQADEQRNKTRVQIDSARKLIHEGFTKINGAINEAQKQGGKFDPMFFDNLQSLITQIELESSKVISIQYYEIQGKFMVAMDEFKSHKEWRFGLVTAETLYKMNTLHNSLVLMDQELERELAALT